MSETLSSLVAKFIDSSPEYREKTPEARFSAGKRLESQIVDEITSEHVEKIDTEARKREEERKKTQDLVDFRNIILECVSLALAVGLLGSHLYGLMEAWLYQPNSSFNYLASIVVTAILVIVISVILVTEFFRRLVDALASIRASRKR